ncbi:MAG: hypothetical protein WBN26_14850, partial [Muriicola sp.]
LYDMTQELAYLVYEVDELITKTNEQKNIKISAKLNDLKKTLVITTGDNYVGSAEPQLREKMADLYSKLASSYDKPSAADLENLGLISERFVKAKEDLERIKKKIKDLETIELMNFNEFLEAK